MPLVSRGAGMTAGLEIHRIQNPKKLVLIDRSPDGRFAGDVATWNEGAAAGLNRADAKKLRDAVAAIQNAA